MILTWDCPFNPKKYYTKKLFTTIFENQIYFPLKLISKLPISETITIFAGLLYNPYIYTSRVKIS